MSPIHPTERNYLDFDTRARAARAHAMRIMWQGLRRTLAPARGR